MTDVLSETSTSLRVRYPEFAVFNAVSASPLRAPCVEEKYSRPFKPFAEARLNRHFDDHAAGLGHQSADAAELSDLLDVALREPE